MGISGAGRCPSPARHLLVGILDGHSVGPVGGRGVGHLVGAVPVVAHLHRLRQACGREDQWGWVPVGQGPRRAGRPMDRASCGAGNPMGQARHTMGKDILWGRMSSGAGHTMGQGTLWGRAPCGAGHPWAQPPMEQGTLWSMAPCGAHHFWTGDPMGEVTPQGRAPHGAGHPTGEGMLRGKHPMGQGTPWISHPMAQDSPRGRHPMDKSPHGTGHPTGRPPHGTQPPSPTHRWVPAA